MLGRLVMEAEKATAYPARLFVFVFLLKFLFLRFLELLWRPVNNLSPLPPPLSRSTAKIRKLLPFFKLVQHKKFFWKLEKSSVHVAGFIDRFSGASQCPLSGSYCRS